MSKSVQSDVRIPQFVSGGGKMGELIRSINWLETPLGDFHQWPQSLQAAVSIMLNTPFPMYIAWGPDFIQLYNDSYRPILGANKHPGAMGSSTRDTFGEIWLRIPLMSSVTIKII